MRTDKGTVRGTVFADHRAFLGIPFAAPPVGPLRWRPPQAHVRWSAPLDATSFAKSCAQLPGLGQSYDISEDCLYLNVYAPRTRRRDLPVMVWVHGGGFTTGTSTVYDASILAVEGEVVVVTIQYRLNVFGFLAHPALDSPESTSGNFGIQDQQAALRWVKRNAAAFGGDPSRVTLFGESAGGLSVCAHLASPDSAGLFDRAITQSGACAVPTQDQSTAEAAGSSLASRLGCTDSASAAACLRGKPSEELLTASGTGGWWPVVGTSVLPLGPREALDTGRFNRVPLMSGANHDEYLFFIALQVYAGDPVTAEEYPAIIGSLYGENAPAVLAEYPLASYPDANLALARVQSDFGTPISLCSVLATDRLASRYVRTYGYEFADPATPAIPLPGFPVGPVHASELQYLGFFGASGFGLDAAQQDLAREMRRYWTRFAATGNPNGFGSPYWPKFKDATDVLWLAPGPGGTRAYDLSAEHHCAFWESLYGS